MSNGIAMLWAGAAGFSFSFIGTAFLIGRTKGLTNVMVMSICGLIGFAVFGSVAGDSLFAMPGRGFAWAIAGAATQYLTSLFFRAGYSRGPFSPVWCALGLAFLPTIAVSVLFFDDQMLGHQWAALAAGVGCVVAGALAQAEKKEREDHADALLRKKALGPILLYALILILVMGCNSVLMIALKVLNVPDETGVALATDYRFAFLAWLYLFSFLMLGGHTFARRKEISWKWLLLSGGLAGLGSMGGTACLSVGAEGAAADVFPLAGITQILTASLVSVLFFRERPSLAWGATVGLGILAVLLANYPTFAQIAGGG